MNKLFMIKINWIAEAYAQMELRFIWLKVMQLCPQFSFWFRWLNNIKSLGHQLSERPTSHSAFAPLDFIVLWYREFFRRALNWVPMMPRDVWSLLTFQFGVWLWNMRRYTKYIPEKEGIKCLNERIYTCMYPLEEQSIWVQSENPWNCIGKARYLRWQDTLPVCKIYIYI